MKLIFSLMLLLITMPALSNPTPITGEALEMAKLMNHPSVQKCLAAKAAALKIEEYWFESGEKTTSLEVVFGDLKSMVVNYVFLGAGYMLAPPKENEPGQEMIFQDYTITITSRSGTGLMTYDCSVTVLK